MTLYEFHITATKDVIDIANFCRIKTIVIDSLTQNGSYLKTEYMTSYVKKFKNDEHAIHEVNTVAFELLNRANINNLEV